MEENLQSKETKEERLYRQHRESVAKYQANNKDKITKSRQDREQRIKDDPEKYKQLQEKRKQYYKNVVKPKLENKTTSSKTDN
jgi:hypothetical protein